MVIYGSELAARYSNPMLRVALRTLGTYDLGARVRFAAVCSELRRLPRPARVLDIGCGIGLLCFAMHRVWPAASITGTDIDNARLEDARKIARLQGTERSVSFSHVDQVAFDQSYDVVTCVDVLEHVSDDNAFVARMFDATRRGGCLVLHVPAADKKRYLAEFPEQADHVRPGYRTDGLVALLRGAGFVDTRVRFTFGAFGALGWEGFTLARQGHLSARAVLPLWYLLAILDSLQRPKRGNGILAVARKEP